MSDNKGINLKEKSDNEKVIVGREKFEPENRD